MFMTKKLIWLACGSGVASSQMAAYTLGKLLKAKNIDATIEVVAFRDIRGKSTKPDLLVSIAPGFTMDNPNLANVPIVMGVGLLTGIGTEKIVQDIIKALNL
jgi:galactitol PTS system EIIB component